MNQLQGRVQEAERRKRELKDRLASNGAKWGAYETPRSNPISWLIRSRWPSALTPTTRNRFGEPAAIHEKAGLIGS